MKRAQQICLVVCCVVGFARVSSAEEAKDLPGFFVAAVRTEVHRDLLPAPTSVYAVVNATNLMTDTGLDESRLNVEAFSQELHRTSREDNSELRLNLWSHLAGVQIPGEAKAQLKAFLRRLATEIPFERVSITETSTSQTWREFFEHVHEFEEAENAEEDYVQDHLVKAYPIRTKLTRLLETRADCVVVIKPSVDGRWSGIPQDVRSSIIKHVTALKLGKGSNRLCFNFGSTNAGYQSVDPLFGPEDSEAKRLAMELGFESITGRHSPNGGAPETLIGQPAPNFTLPTLGDEELDLESFRNGRPALVTFWGVACGPCRLEAPHLSRMHLEHGTEIAIIAVNAYPETAETVREFAIEKDLVHPIVLDGATVARESYHVQAYPTTFWINREGIVTDYVIGFDSPEDLDWRRDQMLSSE